MESSPKPLSSWCATPAGTSKKTSRTSWVTLLHIDATHAHIRSPLAEGEAVVALGVHLLTPGLAVQALPR